MEENAGEGWSLTDPDVLSFVYATDTHLGFGEKDCLRQGDAMRTFEEILQTACALQVDAILHGGDLFHDNRPSRRCLHAAIELLRHYCLGDRPCRLQLLSDPTVNFATKFGRANWEDPNLNVALPLLAIHGNHDDPTGDGALSAVDVLSECGLVNYFGKCTDLDDVKMQPVLLRKGSTHLALYGLGSLRDERLHRLFTTQKVHMLRPRQGNWFNALLFHQNRVSHGATGYIPESFLPDFLDLVLWGHEHDCRFREVNAQRGFVVCQPGSSVATSLSEGEAARCKVTTLLLVKGTDFQLHPIVLRTVRPFVFQELHLSEALDCKALNALLVMCVEQLIQQARQEWLDRQLNPQTAYLSNPDAQQLDNDHDDGDDVRNARVKDAPLPLIRLRVDSGESSPTMTADRPGGMPVINPQRFGQQFVGRVANPKDILLNVRRRRTAIRTDVKSVGSGDMSPSTMPVEEARVEDFVKALLFNNNSSSSNNSNNPSEHDGRGNKSELGILPANELGDCVRQFVDKDDKDALDLLLRQTLERVTRHLSQSSVPWIANEDDVRSLIRQQRLLREAEYGRLHSSTTNNPHRTISYPALVNREADDMLDTREEEEEEEKEERTGASTLGRGSRARGRGGRTRTVPLILSNAAPSSSSTNHGEGNGPPRARRIGATRQPPPLELVAKKRALPRAQMDIENDGGGQLNTASTFAAFTQQQQQLLQQSQFEANDERAKDEPANETKSGGNDWPPRRR